MVLPDPQRARALYEAADTYGNRDPTPAQRATAQVAAALRSLSELPPDHRDFYGRRLATCSSDRVIKVFDVTAEEHSLTGEIAG